MDRVAQEVAAIQRIVDAAEPAAAAARLGALRRQLEKKLPSAPRHASDVFAPVGAPTSGPVSSEQHLLFLVHGIGRHDDFLEGMGLSWDGMPDGQGNGPGGNREFRELLEAQLKTRLRSLSAQIEVHSIEWHSQLRGNDAAGPPKGGGAAAGGGRDGAEPRDGGARQADCAEPVSTGEADAGDEDDSEAEDEALLRACMPEGVAGMRSFMRENVMDGIYYMTRWHNQKIIDAVAEQLRAKYAAFLADHPGFRGGVSVFAHSFGSIIIYDLLTLAGRAVGGIAYPRLPFPVDCFFTCGSPAAMFLVSRRRDQRTCGGDPVLRPRCAAFFNIWSRADPVSWKVEPLLPPPTREGPLVAAADHRSWVVAHTRVARSRMLPSAGRALPLTASRAEALAWLCDNDRRGETDLQLAASRAWISENLAALSAHSAYWQSEDLAFFVLSQLLAPHAADVVSRERAAAAVAAAAPGGPAPDVPAGTPPAEAESPSGALPGAPPADAFALDVQQPLDALGCLSLRSSVTGAFSPVVALVQRGHLCVFGEGQRAAVAPSARVDLRGAAVSNPLALASHGGGAHSGQLPASDRIVLQLRDGRAVEMAAADSAEAGLWVRAMVEAIAIAARTEADRLSPHAARQLPHGLAAGAAALDSLPARRSVQVPASRRAFKSGGVLSRAGGQDADSGRATPPVSGAGIEPPPALSRQASCASVTSSYSTTSLPLDPPSPPAVRLSLALGTALAVDGTLGAVVLASVALAGPAAFTPATRATLAADTAAPAPATSALSRPRSRTRAQSPPGRFRVVSPELDAAQADGGGGEAPAAPAEDDTGGAGPLLAYFGAARVAMMQRRDMGGARRGSAWKPRWVALCGHEVLFYERPPELKPSLCVRLLGRVRVDAAALMLAFAPGDGTLLTLRAPGEAVLGAWVRALTLAGVSVRWGFAEGAAGRVATGRALCDGITGGQVVTPNAGSGAATGAGGDGGTS